MVQVTLPRPALESDAPPRSQRGGVVIRLPDHGGLPEDEALPRGHLLLMIRAGEPSPGLNVVEAQAPAPELAATSAAPQAAPASGVRLTSQAWLGVLGAVLVLVLIVLILLAFYS